MTTILIADDEADVLESTRMVLSMEGFSVTTVQDARRILATLRNVRPDILLQDINMPGLDAAKLIPDIRADSRLKDVRIVVFTASTDSEAICQSLKADGYLQKPFDASRIKETLGRFIRPRPKGVA